MANYDWIAYLPEQPAAVFDIRDIHQDVLRLICPTTWDEMARVLTSAIAKCPDRLWFCTNCTGNRDCFAFESHADALYTHWYVFNPFDKTFPYVHSLQVRVVPEGGLETALYTAAHPHRSAAPPIRIQIPDITDEKLYEILFTAMRIIARILVGDGGVGHEQQAGVWKVSFSPRYIRSLTKKAHVHEPAQHRLDVRAARKLNFNQQVSIHSGYVYVIVNPAFPGWCKIGSAIDLAERLQSYQTYDPLARFSYHGTRYTTADRTAVETAVHEALLSKRGAGEWFSIAGDDAMKLVERFTKSAEVASSQPAATPTSGASQLRQAGQQYGVALDHPAHDLPLID